MLVRILLTVQHYIAWRQRTRRWAFIFSYKKRLTSQLFFLLFLLARSLPQRENEPQDVWFFSLVRQAITSLSTVDGHRFTFYSYKTRGLSLFGLSLRIEMLPVGLSNDKEVTVSVMGPQALRLAHGHQEIITRLLSIIVKEEEECGISLMFEKKPMGPFLFLFLI